MWFGKRRADRLSRIEAELARAIELLKEIKTMSASLAEALASLNAATNAEAANVAAVQADLVGVQDELAKLRAGASAEQLAAIDAMTAKIAGSANALTAVDATLQGLAADPANPVPAPTPAP